MIKIFLISTIVSLSSGESMTTTFQGSRVFDTMEECENYMYSDINGKGVYSLQSRLNSLGLQLGNSKFTCREELVVDNG